MDRTVTGGRARPTRTPVRVEAPLPHTAAGPRLARRRLEESLGREVTPAVLADLQVIASELVANSVVHGRPDPRGTVVFRIDADERRVRLEAEDDGRRLARRPRPRRRSDAALGGRGLRLVDALSDRWGVDPGRPTIVWTEVDVPRGRDARRAISGRGSAPRTDPRAR